jgi:hypothetical protein
MQECVASHNVFKGLPGFLHPCPDEIDGLHCVSKVRNHDRSTHDQGYVHRIVQLFVGITCFDASQQVVIDAVVAPKHHRGHETEQLLRFRVERPVPVCRRIKIKEPLDTHVILFFENPAVHSLAIRLELRESIHFFLSFHNDSMAPPSYLKGPDYAGIP